MTGSSVFHSKTTHRWNLTLRACKVQSVTLTSKLIEVLDDEEDDEVIATTTKRLRLPPLPPNLPPNPPPNPLPSPLPLNCLPSVTGPTTAAQAYRSRCPPRAAAPLPIRTRSAARARPDSACRVALCQVQ